MVGAWVALQFAWKMVLFTVSVLTPL